METPKTIIIIIQILLWKILHSPDRLIGFSSLPFSISSHAKPAYWLSVGGYFVFCGTVYQCHGACAEVDSDTEAVAGKGFKLGCISCKRRSEVEGSATVEWYFRAKGEADFVRVSPHRLESTSHIHDTRLFLRQILSFVLPLSEECPWVGSCMQRWGHCEVAVE